MLAFSAPIYAHKVTEFQTVGSNCFQKAFVSCNRFLVQISTSKGSLIPLSAPDSEVTFVAFAQGLGIPPPRLIVPSFRGLYDQLQAQKSPRPPSIMVDHPQSTSCHRQDPLLRPAELVPASLTFFPLVAFFFQKVCSSGTKNQMIKTA